MKKFSIERGANYQRFTITRKSKLQRQRCPWGFGRSQLRIIRITEINPENFNPIGLKIKIRKALWPPKNTEGKLISNQIKINSL